MAQVDGIEWCDDPRIGFRGYVPCRKCATCRRINVWRWLQRCLDEVVASERTWFVTLTFRRVPEGGGYALVQKWLKRVRKDLQDERIRYFVTPEFGTDHGRLHYHLLVHGSGRLTGRVLRSQWREGITHARLVFDVHRRDADTRPAARYVAKYASKDARPRASVGYGNTAPLRALENPVVHSIFAAFPGARLVQVDAGPAVGTYRPPRPTASISRRIAETLGGSRADPS